MKFNINLEDIKYVKIFYKDSQGESCSTKAAIKRIGEREIIACAKYNSELSINTPQDVVISIVCSDGLYKTKVNLKSVENDEPYIFFIIETPQAIEYEQNREFFRVAVNYDCLYKIKENEQEVILEAKTFDLSANGISLILPQHCISEKSSEIILSINDRKVVAKVAYVRSEKQDDFYRISFKFVKISENDRDFISQVCIQKQLEDRRNALM